MIKELNEEVPFEDKVHDAPAALEDGGQATVDELKELNLGRCQPFSRLMKKDVLCVWDEACHNAFESIKKYLSSLPLLGAPIPAGTLYLSRTLTGPELNYTPIEKKCLALVFAIQKLRH
ncbi:hypothetical protein L3X38_001782 [Prunus dulcis]|uniref:Reverse transcriptase RNase H-like domain-containing protein n=1 Tax=Prunus dulcis TaxID=3755 RepID=A0AAD4ZK59_PRUDU|nr:hypothetical protein L3X38_001782 [Prunus dulcis]